MPRGPKQPPSDSPGKPTARSKPKRTRRPYKRHEASAASRRQVELMAGMGIAQRAIALLMDLTVLTLRSHYKAELAIGADKCNFLVSHALFKSCTRADKPNVDAQKFWLKCRAGWNDGTTPLGKKEQQQLAALTAEEGTEWAGLLN